MKMYINEIKSPFKGFFDTFSFCWTYFQFFLYIIIIIITPWEFFTSALADDLSLESEW